MGIRKSLFSTVATIAIAIAAPVPAGAQRAAAVAIDGDDIGGVVRGPGGPESSSAGNGPNWVCPAERKRRGAPWGPSS